MSRLELKYINTDNNVCYIPVVQELKNKLTNKRYIGIECEYPLDIPVGLQALAKDIEQKQQEFANEIRNLLKKEKGLILRNETFYIKKGEK